MTPDDRPKPRFEPPPWEREAFERFHREREQVRVAEDLERATQAVHPEGEEQGAPTHSTPPNVRERETGLAESGEPFIYQQGGGENPGVSEARIEAMLAELRAEETPAAKAGLTLIYSTVAFLGTTGSFVLIAALMLFTKTRTVEGAASLLTSLASLVMLLTGGALIAGAAMLFRKHQE